MHLFLVFNDFIYRKMAVKSGNWEGLRKQARALENEIDTKLVTFSKLGTNYKPRDSYSDKAPLLGDDNDNNIEAIQHEIESLLSQLGGINDEMAGYAAGAGEARSAAIHHTLQRHTEILQVMANYPQIYPIGYF